MMVRTFGSSVDKLITRAEYEQHLAFYEEQTAKSDEWREANPGESWIRNPFIRGALAATSTSKVLARSDRMSGNRSIAAMFTSTT